MKVSEIFGPTIQGEGDLIGTPTVFVRFGGCDYRCAWCDTLYAVLPEHRDEWQSMTPDDILAEVNRLSPDPILITLSGGNPAIQPPNEMEQLINAGHLAAHRFTVETQGSLAPDWLSRLDHVTVSPKPPSSGMANKTDLPTLHHILDGNERASLKIVVFDDTDLDWALHLFSHFPATQTFLQVGNHDVAPAQTELRRRSHAEELFERLRWLADAVIERQAHHVRVLPQLHTLMYGNQRGV